MEKEYKKSNRLSRYRQAMERYGSDVQDALMRDEKAGALLKSGDLSVSFNAFARLTDPTHDKASQYKYLDWICGIYLKAAEDGKPISAEDLSKLRQELNDFNVFKRHFENDSEKDISYYDSYHEFLEQIRPYQQARDSKKAAKAKMTAEVEEGTVTVYDGPEGRIVRPISQKASQFWGMGTRWCISATESNNLFYNYFNLVADKHIYIYLPKDVSIEERRRQPRLINFKYAAADGTLWDELDHTTDYIHPALGRLIQAALDSEDTFDKEHFIEHGQFSDKPWMPSDPKAWDSPAAMKAILSAAYNACAYSKNQEVVGTAVDFFNRDSLQSLRLINESIDRLSSAFERLKADVAQVAGDSADAVKLKREFTRNVIRDQSEFSIPAGKVLTFARFIANEYPQFRTDIVDTNQALYDAMGARSAFIENMAIEFSNL